MKCDCNPRFSGRGWPPPPATGNERLAGGAPFLPSTQHHSWALPTARLPQTMWVSLEPLPLGSRPGPLSSHTAQCKQTQDAAEIVTSASSTGRAFQWGEPFQPAALLELLDIHPTAPLPSVPAFPSRKTQPPPQTCHFSVYEPLDLDYLIWPQPGPCVGSTSTPFSRGGNGLRE